MANKASHLYRFDSFCVDELKQRLLRSGEHVPIGGKDFEVLLILVKNPGKTIEKDEFLKQVWRLDADRITSHRVSASCGRRSKTVPRILVTSRPSQGEATDSSRM
jgi:DNA-binding winged helix-turn-helix (wHTH) protein